MIVEPNANPEPNPNPEADAPSPGELASAADIMSAMVRTAKGLRMYLPNNPVLIRFVEELNAKMVGHLARFGDFKLQVQRFAMNYKGAEVYENQDPRESMAFRLHSDGICALLFAPGLERHEMAVFLEIVGFERPNQQDDDVVTQLWEKGLPHIGYLLQEDYMEVGSEEEQEAISQQEAISRIFAAVTQNPPLPPRMIPKHLLMLTGEEANWLRKVKQAEEHRNPLDDVISILSAVLAGVKEPEVFRDFVDIMANLACNMFLAGEIGHALRLVRFLDQLLHLGSIGPEQRHLVAGALAGILSEESVQVLQEALDVGESVSHQELRELLRILGLPSLAAICDLLGRVEKLKVRKVIIEVLVELGRDDPKVFAPFLSDPRWYLVRNVVLVLSMMGTPVALELIVGLISHKEARIRKEVLGFLERSADAKAKTYIMKFFRDESSALRIRALQILAREKQAFALKPALALTEANDFKAKDIAEKKAVYETIGELGSVQMVPLFRDMLLKKHWFRAAPEKDSVVCAVAGLLKMKNAAALQLLEEARKQGNQEIRGIIEQAISAIRTGQARAAADSGEV